MIAAALGRSRSREEQPSANRRARANFAADEGEKEGIKDRNLANMTTPDPLGRDAFRLILMRKARYPTVSLRESCQESSLPCLVIILCYVLIFSNAPCAAFELDYSSYRAQIAHEVKRDA